jgi:hypothetical protein
LILINPVMKSRLIKLDLLFISMALILGIMVWQNVIGYVPARLGLEYDYSIGNIYNFSKWLAVAFVFFALWTHSHQPIHIALSIVFTGVFVDDAFEVHEKINAITARISGIPAHYAGAILLIALSAAAGFLMWVVWSKSDKNSQLQARVVIILMGFLVLFGGGLDTLQSDFSGNLAYGIGVFEDGVELLVASTVLVASRIFLKEYVINKNR